MRDTILVVQRLAILFGLLGPILLATTIITLTFVEYDFLLTLRWHPLYAPTTDWPSGLSLGEYGWIMIATFIVSGFMLSLFAMGSYPAIKSKFGAVLLCISGIAIMMLGFKTDPTYLPTPRTIYGALHDLAFVILGLSLIPAMIVLWHHLKSRWRDYARYTLLTAIILFPAFWLKGIFFYIFLAGILIWFEITAIQLWQANRVAK